MLKTHHEKRNAKADDSNSDLSESIYFRLVSEKSHKINKPKSNEKVGPLNPILKNKIKHKLENEISLHLLSHSIFKNNNKKIDGLMLNKDV